MYSCAVKGRVLVMKLLLVFACPIALETKDLFGRRQRCLRLDPTHGFRAHIRKAVNAAHAGPDHIAGAKVVDGAVGGGANMSSDDQVRLFESVIVWIDLRAGCVLNQK